MTESVQLVVDPYLLCLPSPCHSAEQIESFVEALLGWSELIRNPDLSVTVSDAVRLALLDDGEYPYQHRLRGLLQEFRCEVADHETICRLIQRLIDRTQSLEDMLGVQAVLYDENKTSIIPDTLKKRLKERCRSAFMEMLIIISASKLFEPGLETTTMVASVINNVDNKSSPLDIELESELCDLEWTDTARKKPQPLPCDIKDHIPLAVCYEEVSRELGIWTLWRNATNEGAAIDAIELCLHDLIAYGVDGRHRVDYIIGQRFLESARRWGFGSRTDYAMLLVESCARIILGIPKNPLSEFRKNEQSKEQRIRDDGARAYRTHLTKKSAGFRLMLWVLPNGMIEFANVGDKDELIIW